MRKGPSRNAAKKRRRGRQIWLVCAAVGLTALIALAGTYERREGGYGAEPVSRQASLLEPPTDKPVFKCVVASVTDGDTLRCADGVRIRLHAISARERDESCAAGHPCPKASAADSTRFLFDLIDGQELACRRTGRSYRRVTAICWLPNGREVNCTMVRSGMADLWPRYNRETPICSTRRRA